MIYSNSCIKISFSQDKDQNRNETHNIDKDEINQKKREKLILDSVKENYAALKKNDIHDFIKIIDRNGIDVILIYSSGNGKRGSNTYQHLTVEEIPKDLKIKIREGEDIFLHDEFNISINWDDVIYSEYLVDVNWDSYEGIFQSLNSSYNENLQADNEKMSVISNKIFVNQNGFVFASFADNDIIFSTWLFYSSENKLKSIVIIK